MLILSIIWANRNITGFNYNKSTTNDTTITFILLILLILLLLNICINTHTYTVERVKEQVRKFNINPPFLYRMFTKIQTPDINEIFGSKRTYRKRTSSACWDSPIKM